MTCATPPQTLSRLTSGRWTAAHCTVLRDWRPNGNWTTSHVTVHRRVMFKTACLVHQSLASTASRRTYLPTFNSSPSMVVVISAHLPTEHSLFHAPGASLGYAGGVYGPLPPNDCKMKLFAQLQKLKTANQLWIVEITWFFKPEKMHQNHIFP